MDTDRMVEILRKAKIILPFLTDNTEKLIIVKTIRGTENILKGVKEYGMICSPELKKLSETIFIQIEDWYDEIATN